MAKQRFIIIDGNAIIHRAYHALPPLTTKDGTIVNAVFGFTSMLLKVLNELKPDYLAVSFDVSGPTFRDKLYDKYKATRVKADQALYDQIPMVYRVVEAFGIPIYTKQGFEADDVIGTIVDSLKPKTSDLKPEVIIVTGDMDMLQLVEDEKVLVYLLRKGLSDIELYDEKKVKERFGFGPERLVDYKALRGDASDNIPGVKGIGEKTAKELIARVGGVEDIYKQIRNPKSEIRKKFKAGIIKKIEEGGGDAKMSKKLATIRRDVKGLKFQISDCRFQIADLEQEEIKSLFAKFEFFSLLKRVPGYSQQHESDPAGHHPKGDIKIKKQTAAPLTVVSSDNVELFLKTLEGAKEFVCREVLSGRDVFTAEVLGLVLVINKQAYYVDAKCPANSVRCTDRTPYSHVGAGRQVPSG